VTTRTAESRPFIVTHARLVGLLLLLPVPLGIFGSMASRLVVPGDAAATADQILASESLFRMQIASSLLLLVADALLLVLVFYRLLRPVDRTLAALMFTLNLLGVAIAMPTQVSRLAIPYLMDGADPTHALSPEQTDALVALLLNMHDTGSLIAGLFWGLWLVPYALLVWRSGFLPKLLAVLVLIECVAFLIHSLGGLLVPSLAADLSVLPAITTLGELLLPLWLLAKGINLDRWDAVAGPRPA
jgi:hypothetical protein